MLVARLVARVLCVAAVGWSLSGCGVQRMQLGEQEVKGEWGSMLALTDQELDVVEKAWPKKLGGEAEGAMEAAKAELKKSMNRWQEIPSRSDLEEGARAMSLAREAVRSKLLAAKAGGAPGYEEAATELAALDEKVNLAREKYVIAARTYNDILRLYPSKWMAKALMKEPAVTFDEVGKMAGGVTQASMLDKLGVARDH